MAKLMVFAALALVACGPTICEAFLPRSINPGAFSLDSLGHGAYAHFGARFLRDAPRALSVAAGGCPSLGQTCSTIGNNGPASNCIGTGSGTSSAVPAYCNFSLAVSGSSSNGWQSYNNGTCVLFDPSTSPSAIYGAACSTKAQFGCDSSSSSTLMCPDPGNGGTASTCSFSSPAYGDPCVSHRDCRGSNAAASAPLMCNTMLNQCVGNTSVATCQQDSDCAYNFYCNYNWPNPQSCTPMIPIGGTCLATDSGSNNVRCASGGICYSNSYINPYSAPSTNGTCVAPNSLPTGTIAWGYQSDYSWFQAAQWGFQLCSSGLAVPVANATGYPTGQFKCVASVDISQQGTSCTSCGWLNSVGSPNGALPVYVNNPALMCAPTNQTTTPCVLMPTSPYTQAYCGGYPAYVACILSATGPKSGAVKCSSDGLCASAACTGVTSQWYTTIFGPGGLGFTNSIIAQYFPSFTSNVPCVQQSLTDLVVYYTRGGQNVWCSLPSAFTNVGWSCATPGTPTSSPAPPTPTPTSSVTPGLTPTATPTSSVTSGLTPTASPVYPSTAPKSGATVSAPTTAMVLLAVAVTIAAASAF